MPQRVLSAVLSFDSFSHSEGTRTKCFEDCFWRESILRSFWLGNSALDGKQSYCEEKREDSSRIVTIEKREREIGSGSI